MNYLLDTCTFVWLAEGSSMVPSKVRKLFASTDSRVYLSVVSVWEMLVKHTLGKLPLREAPQQLIAELRAMHGIDSLPLEEDAVFQVQRLPELHRDPFDRMLVCQAIAEGLVILTPDTAIAQYPVKTLW